MTAAAGAFDQLQLGTAGRPGYDGHEVQSEHPGEPGFRDGGRAAGGVDESRALGDVAVDQAVEEKGPGEAVLERAGGMHRLILEIQVDAPGRRQREHMEVGIGAAVGVGLDLADRLRDPAPVQTRVQDLCGGSCPVHFGPRLLG